MKLPSFEKARILVVGDVMLDRYWFGDVTRISPEAPVPVLKVSKVEERPGGAANVARNIASLGAHCTLLSVVGADEAGDCLQRLLTEQGGVTAMLHRDDSISTIVKLRAIARHQQLLRIDFETPPSHEVLNAKLADFHAKLPLADVVILSDYGKGGLAHIAEMIKSARAAGKPVLVDPKGDDYARYQGATLLTPNRSEFREVAGSWKNEAELNAKAQKLRTELKLDALLVTRSEEGMSSVSRAGCAARTDAGARSVRCQRCGRHRHRHAGGDAGERRGYAGCGAHRQPCGRRRGGQAGHGSGVARRDT